MSEVKITVSGPVGCGKSNICWDVEESLSKLGYAVKWNDEGEKNMSRKGHPEDVEASITIEEKINDSRDPTARADAQAWCLREWYEANRETWWERYWWRRSDVSDNFMLRLMAEARRIERER